MDVRKITEAATAVMTALEPLSLEERARVLDSAAALHGILLGSVRERSDTQKRESKENLDTPNHDAKVKPNTQGGKRLSIVEFLGEKEPVTNAQRIACFAYYREHVENVQRFARDDFEGYFFAAKLAKPGNYDRDFASAVREGWLHEDGAASYLTQRGETTVQNGFSGKAKPRGASVARRKAQKGK